MRFVARTAIVAATFIAGSNAMAAKPNECLSAVNLPRGGLALRNNCDLKIEVHYCVENQKSFWKCNPNLVTGGGGAATISPGLQHGIQDYGSDGGGSIKYIACFHPKVPLDWDQRRDTFACR